MEVLGREDITTTEIYLHVAVGANGLGVVSLQDRVPCGDGRLLAMAAPS